MPDTIIIVDPHNFAGVGEKMVKALRLKFQVEYFSTREMIEDKQRERIVLHNPQKTFSIFIEPGNFEYMPDKLFEEYFLSTKVLSEIPFGLLWIGSIYRVSNFAEHYKISSLHRKYMEKRRNYFNSLTSLKFCVTEDLLAIDESVVFLGQPLDFPSSIPQKNIPNHYICHIPTAPYKTNYYKGTDKIRKAFEMLHKENMKNVKSEIIDYKSDYSNHSEILRKLTSATIFVHAIPGFPYGLGYSAIEALSKGCLVLSRMPMILDTPIIHIENEIDLAKKITFFVNNPDKFEILRRRQFQWAYDTYSNEAIANRFCSFLEDNIKNTWKKKISTVHY